MPLKIAQEIPQTPASTVTSPPDPETPLPLPGPWRVNEALDYRVAARAVGAVSQAMGNYLYARVSGPTANRLKQAQFASTATSTITTYSTGNYKVKVVPSSSSRRRIVTGNDGSIGIRG